MNFWHMQLHPNNLSWGREKQVLEQTNYIGMGDWEDDERQQKDFQHRMKTDDIVAIKRGGTLIALVKVTGDYEYTNEINQDLDWFERRRKVDVLDWYIKDYKYEAATQATLTICQSNTAKTTIDIKRWYENIMSNTEINKVSELLKYKHQVILQGPPGTGKTRLAKLVAKQLTQTELKGTPESIIDDLVKNFDTESDEVKSARSKNDKLLSRFYESFPKECLSGLSLSEYAIGHGDNDSLCWWLEVGLERLGTFSPGFSNNYPIYWSKKNDRYMLNKKVANSTDDESAMKQIANELSKLIQKTHLDDSIKFFGPCFTLKVLHSYYPDEYFPVNSEKILNNALKLFGSYDNKLGVIAKNTKLNDIYLSKNNQLDTDLTNIEFISILWNNFNLEDGEDLSEFDEVMTHGEYKIIQFHPAYTYEDFVRGIAAKTNDAGNISYEVENKILAEFAKKAEGNPNGNYVLIIDEINRANLPAVLGELIYALEYRDDESMESMYEYEGRRNIKLPSNLYIIGTMNTADRSVGHIDYAIRRRFAFVDILPDETVITNDKAKNLFKKVANLFSSEYLSSDFHKNDVQIGHSYFIVKDDSELATKWQYEIKPILNEYIKDGILLIEAQEVVDSLYV